MEKSPGQDFRVIAFSAGFEGLPLALTAIHTCR